MRTELETLADHDSTFPSREHVQHERRLVAFVYEYGFRICLRLCQVAPPSTIPTSP